MQIIPTIIIVVLIVMAAVDVYAMLCISECLPPAAQSNWNTGMIMVKPCLLGPHSLVRGPDPEMSPLRPIESQMKYGEIPV